MQFWQIGRKKLLRSQNLRVQARNPKLFLRLILYLEKKVHKIFLWTLTIEHLHPCRLFVRIQIIFAGSPKTNLKSNYFPKQFTILIKNFPSTCIKQFWRPCQQCSRKVQKSLAQNPKTVTQLSFFLKDLVSRHQNLLELWSASLTACRTNVCPISENLSLKSGNNYEKKILIN